MLGYNDNIQQRIAANPHPCQVLALAGLAAGLTEAVVINPFEVVKVKLQAERSKFNEASSLPWFKT